MPYPVPTGWGGPQQYTWDATQPPQHVLDAIGGSYDTNQYYWNPDTYSLVDRFNGGSYQYSRQDPANGTDVVTNLSDYNRTGQAQLHYGAGETPFFGFGDSAQGYNAGDAPNSGTFISSDPQTIADYRSHSNDVVARGALQVAMLPALAATGSALGWGAGGAGGAPTVNSMSLTSGGTVASSGATAAAGAGGAAAAAPAAAAGGGFVSNNLPAILSGAATLIGGTMASNAAEDAVDAQVQAGREALDYQRESRDIALGIQRPALQSSQVALARMLSMTGQPIPAALQEALTAAGVTDIGEFNIEDDPSYQFRRDESMRALETGAFARGGGMSGGFANAALRYAQDYASTEYSNIYARLATIGGYGPVAANSSSNTALSYGANASNIAADTGDARASGYVAQSNAWQNALDQISQLPWDQWFGRRQQESPAMAARGGSWG